MWHYSIIQEVLLGESNITVQKTKVQFKANLSDYCVCLYGIVEVFRVDILYLV